MHAFKNFLLIRLIFFNTSNTAQKALLFRAYSWPYFRKALQEITPACGGITWNCPFCCEPVGLIRWHEHCFFSAADLKMQFTQQTKTKSDPHLFPQLQLLTNIKIHSFSLGPISSLLVAALFIIWIYSKMMMYTDCSHIPTLIWALGIFQLVGLAYLCNTLLISPPYRTIYLSLNVS